MNVEEFNHSTHKWLEQNNVEITKVNLYGKHTSDLGIYVEHWSLRKGFLSDLGWECKVILETCWVTHMTKVAKCMVLKWLKKIIFIKIYVGIEFSKRCTNSYAYNHS